MTEAVKLLSSLLNLAAAVENRKEDSGAATILIVGQNPPLLYLKSTSIRDPVKIG